MALSRSERGARLLCVCGGGGAWGHALRTKKKKNPPSLSLTLVERQAAHVDVRVRVHHGKRRVPQLRERRSHIRGLQGPLARALERHGRRRASLEKGRAAAAAAAARCCCCKERVARRVGHDQRLAQRPLGARGDAQAPRGRGGQALERAAGALLGGVVARLPHEVARAHAAQHGARGRGGRGRGGGRRRGRGAAAAAGPHRKLELHQARAGGRVALRPGRPPAIRGALEHAHAVHGPARLVLVRAPVVENDPVPVLHARARQRPRDQGAPARGVDAPHLAQEQAAVPGGPPAHEALVAGALEEPGRQAVVPGVLPAREDLAKVAERLRAADGGLGRESGDGREQAVGARGRPRPRRRLLLAPPVLGDGHDLPRGHERLPRRVDRAPVRPRRQRHVLGPLEAPLDLQARHPGAHERGHLRHPGQVLRRQEEALAAGELAHAPVHVQRVGHSALLRALPAVGAAAPPRLGRPALPAVGDAQGAVNKGLDLVRRGGG